MAGIDLMTLKRARRYADEQIDAKVNRFEDEGDDPDYAGVVYRIVVIDGEPFLEVIEA